MLDSNRPETDVRHYQADTLRLALVLAAFFYRLPSPERHK
mgnify:CR=1 FL=1